MSDQNWRTDTNAVDYFGHQKKQLELADRRPVIRRASDLVGPGIGAGAVRLDNYNDILATFNGYYSSAPGALNAPNETDAFIGQVISDAEFGGRQVFTSMETGTEYSRPFNRSPVDPEAIGWGGWSGQRIPASAQGYNKVNTSVGPSLLTAVAPPNINTIGDSGIYERSDAGIMIRKQGVYTGSISVGSDTANVDGNVYFYRPDGETTTMLSQSAVSLVQPLHIPFTVWVTNVAQGFSVLFLHAEAANCSLWWRFSCTRAGDAL